MKISIRKSEETLSKFIRLHTKNIIEKENFHHLSVYEINGVNKIAKIISYYYSIEMIEIVEYIAKTDDKIIICDDLNTIIEYL